MIDGAREMGGEDREQSRAIGGTRHVVAEGVEAAEIVLPAAQGERRAPEAIAQQRQRHADHGKNHEIDDVTGFAHLDLEEGLVEQHARQQADGRGRKSRDQAEAQRDGDHRQQEQVGDAEEGQDEREDEAKNRRAAAPGRHLEDLQPDVRRAPRLATAGANTAARGATSRPGSGVSAAPRKLRITAFIGRINFP